MPRTPKNNPQSYDDMLAEQKERRGNNKIYKIESSEFRRSELSQLTERVMNELAENVNREKIPLTDFEAVQKQTLLYFSACRDAATIPTILGLSRSLGYSRAALYRHIETHAGTDTAEWLELTRDALSDALDIAALENNINTICAIFIQKSLFNRRESVEIIPVQNNDLTPTMSVEEIQKQYLIDDD